MPCPELSVILHHTPASAPAAQTEASPSGVIGSQWHPNDPVHALSSSDWDLLEKAYDVAVQHIIDPDPKQDWSKAMKPALKEAGMELAAYQSGLAQLPPAGQYLAWAGCYIQALQVTLAASSASVLHC